MEYFNNSITLTDRTPYWIVVPHGTDGIISNGKLIQPIIDWLNEQVGEKNKDWRLKQFYGHWPPVGKERNYVTGAIIKFAKEEFVAAFKLKWS